MGEQATLNIDGTEVHIDGQGVDTIVMIHGWPDTWRLWDAQVEALAPTHRCVRFTLPGFEAGARAGHSVDALVARFKAIVEAVSPGQAVILMLHDWGCVFGYQFAMRHPELVARIIGIDIGDSGSEAFLKSLRWRHKGMIVAYQGWLALAWRFGGALGDRMTRKMAAALRAPADGAVIHAGMDYPYDMLWTGSHGGMRRMRPVEPTCPMLYVYGTRKPFLFHSPGWAEALAARPGSRVAALDCGHWLMVERREAFNRLVIEWLG